MVDFYKQVNTPSIQSRQSVSPNVPTHDNNAESRIRNGSRHNLGTAIQQLIGVGVGVSQIHDKYMENTRKRNELNIKGDLRGSGSAVINLVDKRARDKDGLTGITDLDKPTLETYIKEAMTDHLKASKITNKDYFKAMKPDVDERVSAIIDHQSKINDHVQLTKAYGVLKDEVSHIVGSVGAPEDKGKALIKLMKERVGTEAYTKTVDGKEVEVIPAIHDTMGNGKAHLMQALSELSIVEQGSKSHFATQILKSKDMQDFLAVSDAEYRSITDAADRHAMSKINARRHLEYSKASDAGYAQIANNLLRTEGQVDNFINHQFSPLDEFSRPSEKDRIRLKQELMSSVGEQDTTRRYIDALNNHDDTVMERDHLSSKERDANYNAQFRQNTGIEAETLDDWVKVMSDNKHAVPAFKAHLNKGYKIPPSLIKALKSPASGIDMTKYKGDKSIADLNGQKAAWLAIQRQDNLFTKVSALSKDTNSSLMSSLTPLEYGEHKFLSSLVSQQQDGSITENEALKAYSELQQDTAKNIDSLGNYVSPRLARLMQTDAGIKSSIEEYTTDVKYWIEDQRDQDYRRGLITDALGVTMAYHQDPQDAMDAAIELANSQIQTMENPDGTEATIPKEFKDVSMDKFVEVMKASKAFSPHAESAGIFGAFKDFSFERNLAVGPVNDYAKTKELGLYYNGKLVERITRDELDSRYKIIDEARKKHSEHKNSLDIQKNNQNKNNNAGRIKWGY